MTPALATIAAALAVNAAANATIPAEARAIPAPNIAHAAPNTVIAPAAKNMDGANALRTTEPAPSATSATPSVTKPLTMSPISMAASRSRTGTNMRKATATTVSAAAPTSMEDDPIPSSIKAATSMPTLPASPTIPVAISDQVIPPRDFTTSESILMVLANMTTLTAAETVSELCPTAAANMATAASKPATPTSPRSSPFKPANTVTVPSSILTAAVRARMVTTALMENEPPLRSLENIPISRSRTPTDTRPFSRSVQSIAAKYFTEDASTRSATERTSTLVADLTVSVLLSTSLENAATSARRTPTPTRPRVSSSTFSFDNALTESERIPIAIAKVIMPFAALFEFPEKRDSPAAVTTSIASIAPTPTSPTASESMSIPESNFTDSERIPMAIAILISEEATLDIPRGFESFPPSSNLNATTRMAIDAAKPAIPLDIRSGSTDASNAIDPARIPIAIAISRSAGPLIAS